MKKNAFLHNIFILFIVTFFIFVLNSLVFATTVNTDNTNSQIGNSDIYFSFKNDYYDLVSGIQNDDERFATYLTQKDNYLAYFEQNAIIYDAVNSLEPESLSQEIVITQSTNATIQQIYNLKNLSNESLEEFSNSFVATLKEDISTSFENASFLSEGTYTSISGDIYLYLVFSANVGQTPMQLAYYSSIVNGKANLITLQYLSSTSDEEMHSIIDAFSYQERDTTVSFIVGLIFILVFIGIILVFFFLTIRKKKGKDIPMEYNEKYRYFGGFLLFYFVLLILNAVLILLDFISVMALSSISTIFLVAFVLQDVITLALLIYNAILLWKKKEDTPKKIIRNLTLLVVITIVLCILRMIYSFLDSSIYSTTYYVQEMVLIIRNALYAIIWISYFKNSVRVKSYYREN